MDYRLKYSRSANANKFALLSTYPYFCSYLMKPVFLILFFLTVMPGCTGRSQASGPETLRLAFCGDIMMGTNFPEMPENAYLPSMDGAKLFQHVTPILKNADAAAGNLEGTLLDSGGKLKEFKDSALCYAFRTPVRYVNNLKAAGFDFMAIANNHINDFGAEGRASTRQTLKDASIGYAGLTSDSPYYILERRGLKIGFSAFSPHGRTWSIHDTKKMRHIITHLDSVCDVVVVSFHGGGEGIKFTHVTGEEEICFDQKRGNVKEFARAAVNAGADIVYGHGPHVTRAIELYRDRLIMYSLGNFCTPYRVNLKGLSGHAPLVTVDVDNKGRFITGKIHPFVQQRGIGPVPDRTGKVVRQISMLSASDFPMSPLSIAPDGTLNRKKNCP